MHLKRLKRFDKSYKKLPTYIREKAIERILLFESSPFHPLIHNHALVGEYTGFRSFNVTGDYRIIFIERDGTYEFVEIVDIGTHASLYGM
jgi:addiction module RelE/StbE family toxin